MSSSRSTKLNTSSLKKFNFIFAIIPIIITIIMGETFWRQRPSRLVHEKFIGEINFIDKTITHNNKLYKLNKYKLIDQNEEKMIYGNIQIVRWDYAQWLISVSVDGRELYDASFIRSSLNYRAEQIKMLLIVWGVYCLLWVLYFWELKNVKKH